jgi:hypothetical protein
VVKIIKILEREVVHGMQLLGAVTVGDLVPEMVGHPHFTMTARVVDDSSKDRENRMGADPPSLDQAVDKHHPLEYAGIGTHLCIVILETLTAGLLWGKLDLEFDVWSLSSKLFMKTHLPAQRVRSKFR